jgi:transmembrane sensor
MSGAADIEEQAAQWIAQRSAGNWTQDDQARLDAWLQQATAHRVAFLRLDSVWRRADRLTALRSPNVDLEHRAKRSRRARVLRIAAGIVLAVGLGTILVELYVDREGNTYATDVGARRTVPLSDGTRLELNTDTQIRATVSDQQRVAWLDKGEAYFEVAHDASRPFVVYAGDRRITVLGTKFSVRRDGERVEVAVAEGRVRLETIEHKKSLPAVVITRGGTVIANEAATLVAPTSLKKVADELSWRHGTLMFDKSTLREVADEFNRYNRKQLVIDDEQVGEIRISGAFEAANVEAFARLLDHAFKLTVADEADEIRVSR